MMASSGNDCRKGTLQTHRRKEDIIHSDRFDLAYSDQRNVDILNSVKKPKTQRLRNNLTLVMLC